LWCYVITLTVVKSYNGHDGRMKEGKSGTGVATVTGKEQKYSEWSLSVPLGAPEIPHGPVWN
jgi:hypothetical protein